MNAVIQKHLKKRRRNIPPVTEYFTEQILHQHIENILISIVNVSGRQAKAEQFASVVTHQMQLKSIKPAHCAFTDFSHILKNLVAYNTPVVADGDFSAVYERDTGTFAQTDRVDKKHHGDKNLMLDFHKTIV
jgi:hypothetical protein